MVEGRYRVGTVFFSLSLVKEVSSVNILLQLYWEEVLGETAGWWHTSIISAIGIFRNLHISKMSIICISKTIFTKYIHYKYIFFWNIIQYWFLFPFWSCMKSMSFWNIPWKFNIKPLHNRCVQYVFGVKFKFEKFHHLTYARFVWKYVNVQVYFQIRTTAVA